MSKKPNPTDVYVGARVRTRRLMLAMSQTDLGAALGLSFQQVQKYEKGINRIGASRLQQMAGVLRIAVSFFFEGAPQTFEVGAQNISTMVPDYVSSFVSSADGIAIAQAFSRIKHPKLRRRLADLAEAIADQDDNVGAVAQMVDRGLASLK